jgi:hypothetical protein
VFTFCWHPVIYHSRIESEISIKRTWPIALLSATVASKRRKTSTESTSDAAVLLMPALVTSYSRIMDYCSNTRHLHETRQDCGTTCLTGRNLIRLQSSAYLRADVDTAEHIQASVLSSCEAKRKVHNPLSSYSIIVSPALT